MNSIDTSTNNNQECFFVDIQRKLEVEELRKQEYAKASGFHLDLSTLQWKVSDDESYVMVAQKNLQIVSTMRGEVIDQISLLEKKLECPWNFPVNLDGAVLLLSRAATDSSQRLTGMNLVLRYWFLQLAMHYHIPYVVGTFVTGSPRENSLREMGYQFFTNPFGWQQSTYRSLREVKVVVLDMKNNGEQALQYCQSRASEAIKQYPFKTSFPDIKYVRSL